MHPTRVIRVMWKSVVSAAVDLLAAQAVDRARHLSGDTLQFACDVDYHQEVCDVPMKNPPHPGLSVRHDCLEPLGLTVTAAAQRLGVSRKQLSELVNGRSGISPEMAIRLDKAFGGGADTWYRLQSAYELAQAMKNADRIHVERIPTPV